MPDESDESAPATIDPVRVVVLTIQRYARALNCGHVLFDADRVDELPVWDR